MSSSVIKVKLIFENQFLTHFICGDNVMNIYFYESLSTNHFMSNLFNLIRGLKAMFQTNQRFVGYVMHFIHIEKKLSIQNTNSLCS